MNTILEMIFLCSGIYPISVIICNTSVESGGYIIFPSLSVLFPC